MDEKEIKEFAKELANVLWPGRTQVGKEHNIEIIISKFNQALAQDRKERDDLNEMLMELAKENARIELYWDKTDWLLIIQKTTSTDSIYYRYATPLEAVRVALEEARKDEQESA